MTTAFEIRPAPDGEQRRILRAVFQTPGQTPTQCEDRVTAYLEYARALSLDARRNWWCFQDGVPVCAAACMESPGRTATLFLSSPHGQNWSAGAALKLAQFVSAEEISRGIVLLQNLLEPQNEATASVLCEAGFFDVANLLYMECPHSANMGPPIPPSNSLRLTTYHDRARPVLAELIEATYIESADCQRLSGLRSIDDVIEGHRSVGFFDPTRWLIACEDDVALGCILLAENPIRPVLEIAYMGVRPDSRRRGLGRWLVASALQAANRGGFSGVTLAVDESNKRASCLYRQSGFVVTSQRRALVRLLTSKPVET